MVEVTLNLGSLERGTISDSGSEVTTNISVRTADYVTGNESLYECDVECGIVIKDDIDGSFSGDSSWRNPIPDCPTTFEAIKTDNPNDTCEYYHFVRTCIEPPSQIYPQGRTRQWAGYMINLYPTIGFNHEGNTPKRFMYRVDNEYESSSASLGSKVYASIDMSGEGLITYYKSGTSGETVTKTIFELLFGEKNPDNDDTLSINLEGSRGSKDVPADIALIGYTANNRVVYNRRWVTADVDSPYIENVINYLPISKWKFVFKNEEYYSDIKTEYILKPSVKLRADSWEMTQDDILINSGMCEEIDSEILIYPFPASFWELDGNSLEMFMLPEAISGDILTYPFPKSFWELDDNDKLEMFMLPEPYEEKHDIIHDDVDGKEYFNQHNGTYNNALKRLNNSYRLRLEILSDEETTIGEITKDLSITAAGQITINYEQITRRSCSLSLINVEKKYIPSKNSPFWLNRKFRLWLGLVVDKDIYWWSQGIFYTVSANATGRILSIEAVDKGGALDGTLKLNMTEAQYQFKRGKALTEMIKQTLALDVGNPYGSKNSPIGFGGNRPIDSQPPLVGIEYYGYKTVADISIDANSYISDFFIKLAELYAADCYYNINGNLVFEQHIDSTGYTYVPTQWEFTDLSSTYEDVNYEYSYEGENVVTVYTNATQAGLKNVAWTAYNDNPLSPINVSTGIRRASHIEIPYYNYVDEQELAQAEADLKEIQNEIKEKGIDTTVTVYGNIDCNNRQLLVWDETNLERFEEAYESWGYTAEELAGTISTVMGASSEYDGVEIAYSPILQTNEGAVLLDTTTVDEYIWGLIDNAGSGWNKDTLLNLDRTGLEFDGVLIKNLIADVGTTAIKTGEAMHYVGKYGALAMAQNEVYLVLNSGQAQQIKDCRSVANHYLLTNSIVGMTLNFNTPIIPHIDVNKTIQVTDQYADIEDGIYLVQSVTIPLSGGKMAISATNINWLPNDMTFSGVSEVVENDSSNTYIGNGGGT